MKNKDLFHLQALNQISKPLDIILYTKRWRNLKMGNNETIMLENVYMTDENGKLIPFACTVIVKTHLSLKERIKSFIERVKFTLFLSKKYKFIAEIKS